MSSPSNHPPPLTRPTVSRRKSRPRGHPFFARYRDKPSSLRELAVAAGRRQLRQATWRNGTKTDPSNRTAAMRSRFLALRVRPATRDIPLADDGSLPEQWLLVEWPARAVEPTDYWISNLPVDTPISTGVLRSSRTVGPLKMGVY